MQRLFSIYRSANLLSIDVSIGAMAGTMFFGNVFHVHVNTLALVVLALTVWIIYTADHLLDVWQLEKTASTERHRFHQRNFKALLFSATVLMMVNFALLFCLDFRIILNGLILAAFVFIYILLNKRLTFAKEVIAAALYVSGILVPVLQDTSLTISEWLLVINYFLIAWINLVLFSYLEMQSDFSDNHISMATVLGIKGTSYVLVTLFMVEAALNFILYLHSADWLLVLILGSMTLVLFAIFVLKSSLKNSNAHRFAGDAIFLLPLIYLIKPV